MSNEPYMRDNVRRYTWAMGDVVDARDYDALAEHLAKAVNLLCLARSSLGPAKGLAADIDAFLASREGQP